MQLKTNESLHREDAVAVERALRSLLGLYTETRDGTRRSIEDREGDLQILRAAYEAAKAEAYRLGHGDAVARHESWDVYGSVE